MAMKVKYHFIGGPRDGLVASLPYEVSEISLPSEEPPSSEEDCDKNLRCHGHPYSHHCKFHIYVLRGSTKVRGCYDMVHDGVIDFVDDDNELTCNS
jgi:hypothetical protein